jgi:epoxide hydrolase
MHPGRAIGLGVGGAGDRPSRYPPVNASLLSLSPVTFVAERTPFEPCSAIRRGLGYSKEQSTRPQTVGYGLVDSPAGLCAWIVEKFRAGTDSDGDPANVLTRDEMVDNVMLYWLPGDGASSARLYWESFGKLASLPENKMQVPVGCSVFPKEILRPSRRWAEKAYPDLRYWNEPAKGGHFAAFEQPAIFVDEVRAAFRSFRTG